MKKSFIVLISVASALSFIIVFLLSLIWLAHPRQYSTTDLAEYGNYIGNIDNTSAQEFISSFFPEEIDESFSDVNYSYRAQKNDTHAFEAYLEFQIEETDLFQSYIANNIKKTTSVFQYDSTYNEVLISDEFQLSTLFDETRESSAPFHIQYAKIGKILYSEKEQRIIYVAIGVYDGGIVTTDFLCRYFNRFGIDPRKY